MTAPPTLSVEETHALLDEFIRKNGTTKQFARGVRNYTMALIMLEAGLRVGEVVKLRISDLWFSSGPVTSIIIPAEMSKSRLDRSIPVSTRLSNTIKQLSVTVWPSGYLHQDLYAFYTTTARLPLTTRQVERIINAAGWKAIRRPVHPHMLRHTFASKLMRVTDIRTVQQLLGHKFVTTTQIYTHPNEDDKKKAIEKIEFNEPCRHPLHQGLPSCPDRNSQ